MSTRANRWDEGEGPLAAENSRRSQGFWDPSLHSTTVSSTAQSTLRRSDVCGRCSSEFIAGSRFCHLCGMRRPAADGSLSALANPLLLQERLGLALPSLGAFLIGTLALVAALLTGLFFDARTTLDWQAVQFWRMQWLLVAIAAYLAGILLKRS